MLFKLGDGNWQSVDLWHTRESHDPQHLVVVLSYGRKRKTGEPLRIELQMTPAEVRKLCDTLHHYATDKGH